MGMKKEEPKIGCLQETHLTDRNMGLGWKGGKKVYEDNGPFKQAGTAKFKTGRLIA
jgi:hypothetical protein